LCPRINFHSASPPDNPLPVKHLPFHPVMDWDSHRYME
jgi:hypothetical protein